MLVGLVALAGGCTETVFSSCNCDGDLDQSDGDLLQGDVDIETEAELDGVDGDDEKEMAESLGEDAELHEDDTFSDGDVEVESDTESEIEGDMEADAEVEEDDGMNLGIAWADIPGGSTYVGCQPGDDECLDQEYPMIVVHINDFQMMTTEVTQEQYEQITGDTPSHNRDCPICPVENVTWFEARDFCYYIGARLPSHTEREYAARAGRMEIFICNDAPDCLEDHAWGTRNSEQRTHPVGTKLPNDWGLYDMSGNAHEWVEDCYSETLEGTPDDGSPRTGCQDGMGMVCGGSHYSSTEYMRLSYYVGKHTYTNTISLGFRCARDIIIK